MENGTDTVSEMGNGDAYIRDIDADRQCAECEGGRSGRAWRGCP